MSSERFNRVVETRLGGLIKVMETWFDDTPEVFEGADLWVCHQRTSPISQERWLYFYTVLIDLTPGPEIILDRMSRTTYKEIKRARERDELVISFLDKPTPEDVEAFCSFFDANPRAPGQSPIDRGRIHRLQAAGLLRISKVGRQDGEDLLWRCNNAQASQSRVQCLIQAAAHRHSLDQTLVNLIGRANRLLHFSEMLHFKEAG